MCRLFGMIGHAGAAEYFLRGAPNSLRELGRGNPHGAGVGGFVDGQPRIAKTAGAAHEDPQFGLQPWIRKASTLVGHVRKATEAEPRDVNSHPWMQRDLIMGHNGSFYDLPSVEAELGKYAGLVRGGTDSERYFAMLNRNIVGNGGDVERGIAETVDWLRESVPMSSLNIVMAGPGDLWALRYPSTNTLYWAHQGARDAAKGYAALSPATRSGANAAEPPATIVASEPLDDVHDWKALEPGELLHVRASDLRETVTKVVDGDPRELLRMRYIKPQ